MKIVNKLKGHASLKKLTEDGEVGDRTIIRDVIGVKTVVLVSEDPPPPSRILGSCVPGPSNCLLKLIEESRRPWIFLLVIGQSKHPNMSNHCKFLEGINNKTCNEALAT